MSHSSPSAELLTRRQLSAALGVHMMTVTKWERDGCPVAERGRKGKPSLYREVEVRAWMHLRDEKAQKPGLLDLSQERARKERAQAELAEQTFKARAKELLPAADVEKAWAFEVNAVKTAAMAIPAAQADRLARVATLEGPQGVEAVLTEIIYRLLDELSDDDRELPPASGEARAS